MKGGCERGKKTDDKRIGLVFVITSKKSAEYYWHDTYVDHNAGKINQKYAAKGWNSLPKRKLDCKSTDGKYWCSFLYVTPSGTGVDYTGADAVKVTIY